MERLALRDRVVSCLATALVLGAVCLRVSVVRPATAQTTTAVTTIQVYASGFVNPKQLTFTADGTLYVAEAGRPGDVRVPLPAGYGGQGPIGSNARISRVRPGGPREDFVIGLPNVGLYNGVEMLGASGLAVLDGQLYEVAAGHLTVSPALSRLSGDGKLTRVADVGNFNDEHPPTRNNGDAVPHGNPFALAALQGSLYITDGNDNRVIKASPDGQLSILAQWEDPTTTGIAAGPDGALYVAQFGQAPYIQGSSHIDRVALDGKVSENVVKNLTTPVGVAFAGDGTMYVLQFAAQFSAEKLRYVANGGAVLRVGKDGATTPVVTGLMFPTSMTFGPDGALYVSNYGNESNSAQGQVLRIIVGDSAAQAPAVPLPDESQPYINTQPTPRADAGAASVATFTIEEPPDTQQWGYNPKETTIDAGQAVTFANGGRISHTATASDGSFDTGLIQSGGSATVRFDTPGSFTFFCQPHPWMKATIIVRGQGGVVPAPVKISPLKSSSPPSINPLWAAGFVAALIGVVYLAAFAIRRRLHEAPLPVRGPDTDL